MDIIAFDIETLPDMQYVGILPEVKASGNLKDKAKIEADIKEKKEKQISEMAMNPHTNIVCCFSWYDSKDTSGYVLLEDSEADLLNKVWSVLASYDHYVTFNGRSFDLPTLLIHSMDFGVEPIKKINKSRYNQGNHTDIRLVLTNDDKYASGKLDFFAKRFLKESKIEGIDGQLVSKFWNEGRKDEIAKYCMKDAELTYKLFDKAYKYGLIDYIKEVF